MTLLLVQSEPSPLFIMRFTLVFIISYFCYLLLYITVGFCFTSHDCKTLKVKIILFILSCINKIKCKVIKVFHVKFTVHSIPLNTFIFSTFALKHFLDILCC